MKEITQENFIGFRSIPNFVNHARYVMSRHDYKGRDENGDPIYEHTSPYPVKMFHATHKLGGTNCSVQLNSNDSSNWIYQSREKVLFEGDDNFGFRNFMVSPNGQITLKAIYNYLISYFPGQTKFTIFGEWFGKGIKEKAIHSQFPNKLFFIFDVKKEDGTFLNMNDTLEFSLFINESFVPFNGSSLNIYSVYNASWPGQIVSIDYNEFGENKPWENKNFNDFAIVNKLKDIADKKTLDCPIAKHFGLEGLGEGLVLREVIFTENNHIGGEFVKQIDNDDDGVILKIKNRKYENTKNVIEGPKQVKEKDANVIDFLQIACNENRLEQFFNKMEDPSMKNFMVFIDMVYNDIIKEEQINIDNFKIDLKKLKGEIIGFSRNWYQKSLLN